MGSTASLISNWFCILIVFSIFWSSWMGQKVQHKPNILSYNCNSIAIESHSIALHCIETNFRCSTLPAHMHSATNALPPSLPLYVCVCCSFLFSPNSCSLRIFCSVCQCSFVAQLKLTFVIYGAVAVAVNGILWHHFTQTFSKMNFSIFSRLAMLFAYRFAYIIRVRFLSLFLSSRSFIIL